MKLTFLGTGNEAGVPVFGCDCMACQQARFITNLRRNNLCALLDAEGEKIVLGAGVSDLVDRSAAQLSRHLFLSHFDPDHVVGLFRLRWGQSNAPFQIFCPNDTEGCADLYQRAGNLQFEPLCAGQWVKSRSWQARAVALSYVRPTLGYCIEAGGQRLAWLPVTKTLSQETADWIDQWNPHVLVLDASFPPGVPGDGRHNGWGDVLDIVDRLQPNLTVLTHIGHQMDLWLSDHLDQVPLGVVIAHDGMVVDVSEYMTVADSFSHSVRMEDMRQSYLRP